MKFKDKFYNKQAKTFINIIERQDTKTIKQLKEILDLILEKRLENDKKNNNIDFYNIDNEEMYF